jgi:hypothetical protein
VTTARRTIALVAISVGAGFAGIALAWLLYVVRPALAGAIEARTGFLYRLLYGKYFVDEIYDALVVWPIEKISRVLLWRGMDVGLIDGAVNGAGIRRRDRRAQNCTGHPQLRGLGAGRRGADAGYGGPAGGAMNLLLPVPSPAGGFLAALLRREQAGPGCGSPWSFRWRSFASIGWPPQRPQLQATGSRPTHRGYGRRHTSPIPV